MAPKNPLSIFVTTAKRLPLIFAATSSEMGFRVDCNGESATSGVLPQKNCSDDCDEADD